MMHPQSQPPLISTNPMGAGNGPLAQTNGTSSLVPVNVNYPPGVPNVSGQLSQPHMGQMQQPSHPTQITYPQKVNPPYQPRFSPVSQQMPPRGLMGPGKMGGFPDGENGQQPIPIVGSSNLYFLKFYRLVKVMIFSNNINLKAVHRRMCQYPILALPLPDLDLLADPSFQCLNNRPDFCLECNRLHHREWHRQLTFLPRKYNQEFLQSIHRFLAHISIRRLQCIIRAIVQCLAQCIHKTTRISHRTVDPADHHLLVCTECSLLPVWALLGKNQRKIHLKIFLSIKIDK